MGTLYLVSTPIGNLEDITIRALKTLFSVDIIACEDTRLTGQLVEFYRKKYMSLFTHFKKPVFISYRDTNEQKITPELIHDLETDKDIAIVSDSGTPLISDPGYNIVSQAKKRSIPIIVVPGASAFLTALLGSGLPVNKFTFLGYLPEKQGNRMNEFTKIQENSLMSQTYVLYVAPHKLLQTLADMKKVFGNIPLVIARELTKIYEEFFHGTIEESEAHFQNPKGEFVILFTLQ